MFTSREAKTFGAKVSTLGHAAALFAVVLNVVASTAAWAFSTSAPATAQFFTIDTVLAKRDEAFAHHNETRQEAHHEKSTAATSNTTEPFGLSVFKAPESKLWSKWRGVEADIARDKDILDRCENIPDTCPTRAAQFLRLIKSARVKSGRDRLDEINQGINTAIRYTGDGAQEDGETDGWSSPLATFATAQGDCEDFAIAKYVALREIGIAASDLRLVLAHDRIAHADHAVLAVRQDGRWLIMDNRFSAITNDNEAVSLTPLFAIGNHGVQLFAAPLIKDAVDEATASSAPAPQRSEKFDSAI